MNVNNFPRDLSIPCYGCKDRFVDVDNGVTCHGTCEKYAEYRKEHEAKQVAKKEYKEQFCVYEMYQQAAINRMRKKREKGR